MSTQSTIITALILSQYLSHVYLVQSFSVSVLALTHQHADGHQIGRRQETSDEVHTAKDVAYCKTIENDAYCSSGYAQAELHNAIISDGGHIYFQKNSVAIFKVCKK